MQCYCFSWIQEPVLACVVCFKGLACRIQSPSHLEGSPKTVGKMSHYSPLFSKQESCLKIPDFRGTLTKYPRLSPRAPEKNWAGLIWLKMLAVQPPRPLLPGPLPSFAVACVALSGSHFHVQAVVACMALSASHFHVQTDNWDLPSLCSHSRSPGFASWPWFISPI